MLELLLGGAIVGGIVGAAANIAKQAGENEQKKRQAAYLNDMAANLKGLREGEQVDYEKNLTQMNNYFDTLSSSTRKLVMDETKSQLDIGAKRIEFMANQTAERLKSRGDEYSKFLGEQVQEYGQNIGKMANDAGRTLAVERMRHKVSEVFNRGVEQEQQYRVKMEQQNQEFQKNIATQLNEAGQRSMFEQQQLADQLVGHEQAALAQAEIQNGVAKEQAYQNALSQHSANIQNLRMQEMQATGMAKYMNQADTNWWQTAASFLQPISGVATTFAAGAVAPNIAEMTGARMPSQQSDISAQMMVQGANQRAAQERGWSQYQPSTTEEENLIENSLYPAPPPAPSLLVGPGGVPRTLLGTGQQNVNLKTAQPPRRR